jgi:hypothetical protein
MPKLKTYCLCLLIVLTAAPNLQAALEFGLDFGQDGEIESSWRLKAGEEVQLDIYVSNVPEPGLQAMGFKFVYDAERLEIVEEESGVDLANWPYPGSADSITFNPSVGELEMAGFRLESGLSGDNIRLGTLRLRSKKSGSSILTIRPWSVGDGLVLELLNENDPPTVLDGDLGDGIVVGRIAAPVANTAIHLLLLFDE